MGSAATSSLSEKVSRLEALLSAIEGGVLVAFSGGTDSALLAAEAARVLGARCTAVIADSPSLPRAELSEAVEFARRHGIPLEVVQTTELADPAFVANDAYRCYHCKKELFTRMAELGESLGRGTLLFGAIADDVGDWRPGMEAARHLGVRAPLMEAGFTKADVRERSRELGLETADKPASACLSSRFPEGRPISIEELEKVEKAEALLKRLGLAQCRVRLLGDAARLEVELDQLGRLVEPAVRTEVVEELKGIGFRFVTLDLEGFRSGSLSPRPSELRHGIRRDT
jgi:pyridinium-3,5-biscarboxylic acid mononucleotide sulfurtransferase